MFRQKQKNFHTTMAVIKGCEWEAGRVKEATLLLIEHLCGTGCATPTTPVSGVHAGSSGGVSQSSGIFPVTMNMEISPIHHSVVVGTPDLGCKCGADGVAGAGTCCRHVRARGAEWLCCQHGVLHGVAT